ncbi:MAG: hypothetical protein RL150_388 [Candidatus Parcubacteria bacterium]|jgi:hypothetical protein
MRGIIFKKSAFSLLCVALVSAPFLVFSQEVVSDAPSAPSQGYFIDNTKPENERVVESATFDNESSSIVRSTNSETQEATTETDTPTEDPAAAEQPSGEAENAADAAAPEPQEEAPTAQAAEEAPAAETTTEPAPEPVAEKPTPAPVAQPQEEVEPPMRTFTKKIFVNKDAVHTCTAEVFSVDMSGRTTAQNTLQLTKEADIAYELEVGSLPTGIDVRFTDGNSYYKNIGLEDESADFTISLESNAAKGSFTIPIIYTQKGVFDSSVVCQVNVVNQ